MNRRQLLASGAATAVTLFAPNIARAADSKVLRFIPQADLAVLDPVWTTAYVTRNHGMMVFDTLFGQDLAYQPQPQMVKGVVTGNDGKNWTLTLRDGLRFHDNTPVLARDCVASIERWGKRDAFGQALLAATDELSAPDDMTIAFRLKRPFPLLPDALGKAGVAICPMMPERLAKTDPFKQVTEMVGSGPFRFLTNERIPGAKVVYERFAGYVPRPDGTPSLIAGPKVVKFDRVEWYVIPDAATALGALQKGEVDWWEYVNFDLLPVIKGDSKLKVDVLDPSAQVAMLRMNQLHPPFNNPAIRRALLGAVNQSDFMTAVAGTDKQWWKDEIGYFPPTSKMASDVGMDALLGPRDYAKAKQEIVAAGYKGEPIVVMVASDFPTLNAMALVGVDMLRKVGFNVDMVETDWGSVVQRRASRNAPDKGGWSVFFTNFTGLDENTPAGHLGLRGNGDAAWFGWPTAPKLEALRDTWFEAPDLPAQLAVAKQIQAEAFREVPYVPLGEYLQPTGYTTSLKGLLSGMPIFWNVERA
jgi:peptide/nickel transport system substrate-binding protein